MFHVGHSGLTAKQRAAMLYLQRFFDENGIPPSRRQMAAALGYAGPGAVSQLIDRLCERGYLSRIPKRSRALQILVRVG